MGSITDDRFDYIIVGGGTAGLTVANRLSEDAGVQVLVIEAGANNTTDPLVLTPGLVPGLFGNPKYDWNFKSVPQSELYDKQIVQPRGRQLGGSSAVNFMMLVYPTRISLDAWGEVGNEGWNYDTMAPYLHKFATMHSPPQSAKDACSLSHHDEALIGNGPIQASFSEGYSMANTAWMKAFANLGLETTSDVRAEAVIGAFQQPASIDPATKTRSYSATAYYNEETAARRNLTVLTETLVKKVILSNNTGHQPVATGVLVETKDGSEKVYKGAEIILSAGSLMSPQILELSGIGSKSVLDKYNIPVVVENEWVGENVQDHPVVCQSFEVKPEVPSADILRDPNILDLAMIQFQNGGQGPLGQSNISSAYVSLSGAADGSGSLRSTDPKSGSIFAGKDHLIKHRNDEILRRMIETTEEPTIEHILFPMQVDTTIKVPGCMADYTMPERPENFITVMSMLNHPFSRGSVHITSGDVHEKPSWDPNFCSNTLDYDILGRHLQFVERLVKTEPFSSLLKPGGVRFPDVSGDTMDGAIEIIRRTLVSLYHPAGSCGMRPKDQGGVVDSRLRVYGVTGLRVVDASIFPLEPAGNIQSVVYAVAEKAADIIKGDRGTM